MKMRGSEDGSSPPTDIWNEAAGAPYGDPSHYAPDDRASRDHVEHAKPIFQPIPGPRGASGARARRIQSTFPMRSRNDDLTTHRDRPPETNNGFAQRSFTWLVALATGLSIVFLLIWSWHMVCPVWLEFVPAAKMVWLSDLVKFGAGGALGAILMKYFATVR
jgi:hypothetical protein